MSEDYYFWTWTERPVLVFAAAGVQLAPRQSLVALTSQMQMKMILSRGLCLCLCLGLKAYFADVVLSLSFSLKSRSIREALRDPGQDPQNP